jgi:hypothetical protein
MTVTEKLHGSRREGVILTNSAMIPGVFMS